MKSAGLVPRDGLRRPTYFPTSRLLGPFRLGVPLSGENEMRPGYSSGKSSGEGLSGQTEAPH